MTIEKRVLAGLFDQMLQPYNLERPSTCVNSGHSFIPRFS